MAVQDVHMRPSPGTMSLSLCAMLAVVGLGFSAAAGSRTKAAMRATLATEPSAGEEDEVDVPAPAKKGSPPGAPFDPSKQPGVTLPLMYFDPAGFCKVGDKEGFRDLRAKELKHGRVAMFAALGAVVQHWARFPGFNDVPNGLEAVITPPGTFGLLAVVAAAGFVETQVWVQSAEREPGDFGDPAGIGQYYEEWKNRELNNGRMAMLSIMGILAAELATGRDSIEQIWQPLGNLPVE